MTSDELREAVRAVLARKEPAEGVCPRCHGTGRVHTNRPVITQAALAEAIGTTRPSVSAFLSGQQGFKMDTTLRLLDWLGSTDSEGR